MTRRVAVLLNEAARGVNARMVRLIYQLHDPKDVFVTRSVHEAQIATRAIVSATYGVLCTGGGDGTFIQAANDVLTNSQREPILFALRLGSGNAIADVCGASPPTPRGIARDLARAAGDERPGMLPLLAVGGRLTHFVGFGLDAMYNQDLDTVAKRYKRGLVGALLQGGRGMFVTGVVRTLPRLWREPRPRLRIFVERVPANKLDACGRATGADLRPGSLLYDGPVLLASMSTICTFGRGVRFFPFAEQQSGRFQLRVSNASLGRALVGLGKIVSGATGLLEDTWDFAVAGVRVEMMDAGPMQIAGDLSYPRGAVHIQQSDSTVPILRAESQRPG